MKGRCRISGGVLRYMERSSSRSIVNSDIGVPGKELVLLTCRCVRLKRWPGWRGLPQCRVDGVVGVRAVSSTPSSRRSASTSSRRQRWTDARTCDSGPRNIAQRKPARNEESRKGRGLNN